MSSRDCTIERGSRNRKCERFGPRCSSWSLTSSGLYQGTAFSRAAPAIKEVWALAPECRLQGLKPSSFGDFIRHD